MTLYRIIKNVKAFHQAGQKKLALAGIRVLKRQYGLSFDQIKSLVRNTK
jgi:hypothetical protein